MRYSIDFIVKWLISFNLQTTRSCWTLPRTRSVEVFQWRPWPAFWCVRDPRRCCWFLWPWRSRLTCDSWVRGGVCWAFRFRRGGGVFGRVSFRSDGWWVAARFNLSVLSCATWFPGCVLLVVRVLVFGSAGRGLSFIATWSTFFSELK